MNTSHAARLAGRVLFTLCVAPGSHVNAAAPDHEAVQLARMSPSLAVPFVAVGSPRATKGPLFGNSVYNPRPCPVVESGMPR